MSSTRVLEPQTLRILIADDTDIVRWSLRRLLGSMGHRVDEVENGIEAVEAIKRKDYELVLLDLQMPRMGGVEAALTLFEEGLLSRGFWVVAMSASSEIELGENRETFDRFLTKPVRLDDLKVLISDVARALSMFVPDCVDSQPSEWNPLDSQQ